VQITDSAVIRALELAKSKNKIISTQPNMLPTPPYSTGDLWANATGTFTYTEQGQQMSVTYNNDILKCIHARERNETPSITDWILASRYTDDSLVEHYTNLLTGVESPAQGATEKEVALAAENAIRNALGGKTITAGGLMLTSLIGLRQLKYNGDPDVASDYITWAGISGEYDDWSTTHALGHGIAAWYGGDMVDKESLSVDQIADGWNGETYHIRWAKSVDRFDGSGYRADGNITWDAQGRVSIKDITTLVGENDTDLLNELMMFNNAFHFQTQQGTTTVLGIIPQAGFTELNIVSNGVLKPVATQEWVNNNYVEKTFFAKLFQAYDANGNAIAPNEANDTTKIVNNIKAMVGFWTNQYVTAYGLNSGSGGGVTLHTLLDSLNNSGLNPSGQTNKVLVNTNGVWSWQTYGGGGTVTQINVGNTPYTPNNGVITIPNYSISGGTIYIGNASITPLTALPTVTVGTPAAGDTTYTKVVVDTYGRVIKATTLVAADIPSLSWNKITTDKPTTLAGYGITDGVKNDTTWWGRSISNGAVSGAMTSVDSITATSNGSGYIQGFHAVDLYGASGGSNGGHIDFRYAGASSYTSRIIESESGLIEFLTKIKTSRIYLYKPSSANDTNAVYLEYNSDSNVNGVHLVGAGFYADTYITAYGLNSSSGGGGATLYEPLSGINGAGLGAPSVSGETLVWTGSAWRYSHNNALLASALNSYGNITSSAGNFVASAGGFIGNGFTVTGKDNTSVLLAGGGTKPLSEIGSAYTLPAATSSALGGIKIGYSENNYNFAVKLSNEKAYVTVDLSEYALTTDLNDYLPLSAGSSKVLSGELFTTSNIKIKGYNNRVFGFILTNGGTATGDNVDVGWNWSNVDGSGAYFRSTDAGGSFGFYARSTSSNTKQLIGTTAGSLTWDGNELATRNWVEGKGYLANVVITGPVTNGQIITFDANTSKWVNGNASSYSLPLAANGTRGGVQIGYSTSGKNYAVQLSSEKMYVNVPWTDTDVRNTTGGDNSGSKLFLVGMTEQTKSDGNSRTYTNSNCYASGGYLYSGGLKVATENYVTSQGYITSSSLSGYLPLSGGTLSGDLILGTGCKLGIGTSSPSALFHANGTSIISRLLVNYSDVTTGHQLYVSGTTYLYGNTSIIGSLGVGKAADSDVAMDILGQIRMRITDSDTQKLQFGLFTDTKNAFIRFTDGNGSTCDVARIFNAGTTESPTYVLMSGNYNRQTRIIGNNVRLYSRTSSDASSYGLALTTMYGGRVNVGSSTSYASTYTDCTLVVDGYTYTSRLVLGTNTYLEKDANDTIVNVQGGMKVTGVGMVGTRLLINTTDTTIGHRLYVNSGTSYLGGNTTINGDLSVSGSLTMCSSKVTVSATTVSYSSNTFNVIKFAAASNYGFYLAGTPCFGGAGWTNISDIRKKIIMRNVGASIDQIANAPVFDFKWKEQMYNMEMLGSSAQYWQQVFPNAIKEFEGTLTMDYSATALAAAVITARTVQNHEDRIRELEHENEALRNEIAELKKAA
jgi:hypothetical protein